MKKIIKLLTIIFLLFFLTACDYKEINDNAIVSAISIDKSDKQKYEIGIQIMNAKKDEESTNSLITFYKASGNTIYEAIEKINLESPKDLYFGHAEVVVISDTLLKKENPINYMDYFMRDPSFQKDALVIAAKEEKAYNVLKIITPLETIPSKNLKSTLFNADTYSGTLTFTTVDKFVSNLIDDGVETILPSVIIKGSVKNGEKTENIEESDPKAKLKFKTLAYFKNNKLKGYLTNNESLAYNLLSDNAKNSYLNISCGNDKYSTLYINKSNLKEKIYFKNNIPTVNIKAKITTSLVEYNCSANFIKNNKDLDKIEKKLENKIKKIMYQSTNTIYKKYNSDILHYGSKFYKTNYKQMKSNNLNYKNIINKINFNIDVDVSIKSTKLSTKSVIGGIKNE